MLAKLPEHIFGNIDLYNIIVLYLGVDWWIILGTISRRWDVGIWTGFGWPRIETGGGRL